ncbi:hypothetical protein TELCIR_16642 [Teladorsagia circumcincta]|uniref:Uncharacterized protein n=1 Tax=Teladorsagia circumcincta TaxID=45464 RepID=A0A2G9TUX4_TELCI|nr:hypothetical protein TELCIR_16642 [Teladorsagia circumcincta]
MMRAALILLAVVLGAQDVAGQVPKQEKHILETSQRNLQYIEELLASRSELRFKFRNLKTMINLMYSQDTSSWTVDLVKALIQAFLNDLNELEKYGRIDNSSVYALSSLASDLYHIMSHLKPARAEMANDLLKTVDHAENKTPMEKLRELMKLQQYNL